jgi:hypothetical protein
MTLRRRPRPRRPRVKTQRAAYILAVRGRDGRPHYERFDDAASYRARLMTLQRSSVETVSIDDILSLLDDC